MTESMTLSKKERQRLLRKGRNIRNRHGTDSAEYLAFYKDAKGMVNVAPPTTATAIEHTSDSLKRDVCERTKYRHSKKLRETIENIPPAAIAFALTKAVAKDPAVREALAEAGAIIGEEAEVVRTVLQEMRAFNASTNTARTADVNAARNAVATVIVPGTEATTVRLRQLHAVTGFSVGALQRAQYRKGATCLLGRNVTWCLLQRKVQCNKLHPKISELIRTFYDLPENTRADPQSGTFQVQRTSFSFQNNIVRFVGELRAPKATGEGRHCKHWLEKTQTELYLEYLKWIEQPKQDKWLQNLLLDPDASEFLVRLDIGQRLFEMNKPWYVRTMAESDRIVCACHKHCNVKALVVALARQRRRSKSLGVVYPAFGDKPFTESLNETVRSCLCPPNPSTGRYSRSCLWGECEKCGASRLLVHEPWELDQTVKLTVPDKDKGGTKQIDQVMCSYEVFEDGDDGKLCFNKRVEPVARVLERLMEGNKKGADSLAVFTRHQFVANWQHQRFTELFDLFAPGEWILQYDFAENHTFNFQYEVQSYHWCKTYCTLLVFVGYRHASRDPDGVESTPDNRIIVKEEYHFISDDRAHDPAFVDYCLNLLYTFNFALPENSVVCPHFLKVVKEDHNGGRGFPVPKRLFLWSDGAPTQFKLKDAYWHHFWQAKRFGFQIWRMFWGSGHGKGVHDSAGGTIKRECATFNLNFPSVDKGALKCARDMFEFCKVKLSQPKLSTYASRNASVALSERHFFLVEEADVGKQPREKEKIKPVKGSSTKHLFIFNPSSALYHFQVRCLLCTTSYATYILTTRPRSHARWFVCARSASLWATSAHAQIGNCAYCRPTRTSSACLSQRLRGISDLPC
jgi:hypothetical protein